MLFRSKELCGWLNTDRFIMAHKFLKPESYIESCVFDMCAGMDLQEVRCNYAESYATEATSKGADISWREGTDCGKLASLILTVSASVVS